VLSTGDAGIAATTSNTAAQKTLQQHPGVADVIEPDLQAQSTSAGYSQSLHDQVTLQFDVTPTTSGPLAFQYIFGSEEYPDFAPSAGVWCVRIQTACGLTSYDTSEWLR